MSRGHNEETIPISPERAQDLYEDAPCGYLSTLTDGTIVRVNRTFEEWTGLERDALVGKERFDALLTAGGRIYYETHCRPLLQMQGSVREVALEIACTEGRQLPVLMNAVLHREDEQDDTPEAVWITIFDASDRRAYEQELLRARRRAERLQRNSAVLAEASRVLDVDREVVARVRALLELLVREVANAAALQLADPPASRAVAGAADDELLVAVLEEASESEELRVRRPAGGPLTYLAVPLCVHGNALGALAVSMGEEVDENDGPKLLEAVADRAAVAIGHAKLYERERTVALGLQRAMLPRDLLEDERCQIAAHYSAAVDALEVGGDWYDAFRVSGDRIGLVVGDVVGKGLAAATTMGQLRSALRAHGISGLRPHEILEHLDAFVAQTENADSATVALADIDLAAGELQLACAGHPPPILLPPDGDPVLIWEGRSPPLGFPVRETRSETGRRIEPGSRLLFYSDGAVEQRNGDIDVGIERLMSSFAARRDEPLDAVVASLGAEIVAEQAGTDDVCLLAYMFAPGSAP